VDYPLFSPSTVMCNAQGRHYKEATRSVSLVIILAILLWGMLAGWIANMILGGSSRPADWGPLLGAGLAGSFVGGLVLNLLTGNGLDLAPSGLIGTVLGAVIVLAVLNAVRGRS